MLTFVFGFTNTTTTNPYFLGLAMDPQQILEYKRKLFLLKYWLKDIHCFLIVSAFGISGSLSRYQSQLVLISNPAFHLES